MSKTWKKPRVLLEYTHDVGKAEGVVMMGGRPVRWRLRSERESEYRARTKLYIGVGIGEDKLICDVTIHPTWGRELWVETTDVSSGLVWSALRRVSQDLGCTETPTVYEGIGGCE